MAYSCSMESLISVLHERAPAKADALARSKRQVQYGRLSVGLKIHIMPDIAPVLEPLFSRLRDVEGKESLDPNMFQKTGARWCMVIPPLGSANATIDLLHGLQAYSGAPFFGNKLLQLQICSPGRIPPQFAALLSIAFYLGSDTLRRYAPKDLETTFSKAKHYSRARRLALYDARGSFDERFEWWEGKPGNLKIRSDLPFKKGRTDILVGPGSVVDIKNINLVATLLAHVHHQGFWNKLGREFIADLRELLREHKLLSILNAPWIREDHDPLTGKDEGYFKALDTLVGYSFNEKGRFNEQSKNVLRWLVSKLQDSSPEEPANILLEMRALLARYHAEVVRTARENRQEVNGERHAH